MQDHSCLKITVSPNDFKLGDGKIKSAPVRVPDGNWLPYIEYYERQLLNTGDTNGCVIFTWQEDVDAQIDVQMEWLIQNGKVPQSLIDQFTEWGYMDSNSKDGKPHFHSSPRFLQILTGNGLNGNNLVDAPNAARTYGILPYTDLPVDPSMTPEEYVNPSAITQAMYDKAKQFLVAIGGKNAIQYQWITDGGTDIGAMKEALPAAPLALGINVGSNWNTVTPPAPAPSAGGQPGHSVLNYMIDGAQGSWIYDHYLPNPKDLVAGYPIWYSLQTIITITPLPPVPTAPSVPLNVASPVNVSAWTAWLNALSLFLANLYSRLSGLKGRKSKQ